MSSAIALGDIVRLKWTHEIWGMPTYIAKRMQASVKYTAAMRNTPLVVISKSGYAGDSSIECLAPTGDVLRLKEAGVTKRGPWNV